MSPETRSVLRIGWLLRARVVQRLGITAQLNSKNERHFVALYSVDSLQRLIDVAGVDLEERPRTALDELVRARGAVPPPIVSAIQTKRELYRMSFEAIAHLMNEKGIVDGMGGRGWTAKKVRAAYRGITA